MQMKLFFALAISAISAASLPVHDHVDPRSLISRDSNAITKFREWMVAIEEGGVVRCGGMIISPTVVLTARGCAEVGHTIRAGARVSYRETRKMSPLWLTEHLGICGPIQARRR